jgi:hypothetical protein
LPPAQPTPTAFLQNETNFHVFFGQRQNETNLYIFSGLAGRGGGLNQNVSVPIEVLFG